MKKLSFVCSKLTCVSVVVSLPIECLSLGLPEISLVAGTLGEILEERRLENGEEEEYLMVSWACHYSYWHLLAALLAKLRVTPGIGVGEWELHVTLLSKETVVFFTSICSVLNPI